jgi:uncharacterized protein YjiK
MKYENGVFFEKLSRNFQFHPNIARITDTVLEDQYTILIISRTILLRTKNVSDKTYTENRNTHFMFNNLFSKIVPFMR